MRRIPFARTFPLLFLCSLLWLPFAISFPIRVRALLAPPVAFPTNRPAASVPPALTLVDHRLVCTSRVKLSTSHRFLAMQEETEESGLLVSWINHSSADFHSWKDPAQVEAIRFALLTWYRGHRRALPWRGDPPPWNGSTADFATKAKETTPRNGTGIKKQQKQLTDFFRKQPTLKSCSTSTSNGDNADSDNGDEQSSACFPVTAYGVWVSEIMLQQTRVEAVIPYWIKWMKAFPTVSALAKATDEQVNAHWAGLGFYRRARLLHQAAKLLHEEQNGKLPQTVEGLLKLPGIGRYTASAIASIAYNVTVPVVDGNVCRVLSRLRGIAQHVKAPVLKDQHAWDLAAEIVQAGNGKDPGEVNQALMELGATYCAPSGTGVDESDPLKGFYWSTRIGREAAVLHRKHGPDWFYGMLREIKASESGEAHQKQKRATKGSSKLFNRRKPSYCQACGPDGIGIVLRSLVDQLGETDEILDDDSASRLGHSVFPIAPPKNAKREEVLALAAISRRTGTAEEAWLLVRRPNSGLLAGQWEFPSVCLWNSDELDTSKKGAKRKDMSYEIPNISKTLRRKALNGLLEEVSSDDDGILVNGIQFASIARKHIGDQPLEHIFSHVRHTMWVETGICGADTECKEWADSKGRHLRWMKKSDMNEVGITSGVKKVLRIVQNTSTQERTKKDAKRAKKNLA